MHWKDLRSSSVTPQDNQTGFKHIFTYFTYLEIICPWCFSSHIPIWIWLSPQCLPFQHCENSQGFLFSHSINMPLRLIAAKRTNNEIDRLLARFWHFSSCDQFNDWMKVYTITSINKYKSFPLISKHQCEISYDADFGKNSIGFCWPPLNLDSNFYFSGISMFSIYNKIFYIYLTYLSAKVGQKWFKRK